ncbi:MAG: hypothetical protein EB078_04225 [Proteobacteria bacterium]|nr:hypothetical protein [Pseudomonadota bacterium]NDC24050.1 hypothetical protein [Pseudomonadota bacterium]NDD04090.1 hypothetical protein [Pseudomonadota bacterium]NDG26638.1 hypothetical protein [Pseudomonadota bacterium]
MISDSSIKWVENLAEQEQLIRLGKLPGLDIGQTRGEVLAVGTAVFLRQLRTQFLLLVKLFNARMAEPSLNIQLVDIPEKTDGFYLQRNHVKLSVVSNRSGFIQIQCEKSSPEVSTRPSIVFSGVVEGRFSNFEEVNWVFLENPINAEQLSRYYLTEFLQSSRSLENLS